MPLADLSQVTRAVLEVLRLRVPQILPPPPAPPPGAPPAATHPPVNVTAAPPDDALEDASGNLISFFLYHALEDPYFKNAPPESGGRGAPEVAQAPLALTLYYVLTVHHQLATDASEQALQQQRIFGAALKTLHDIPVITHSTVVEGVNIFDFAMIGGDNVIEIIYRPLTPEDSIAFWTAEQERVTRLSAYYELRVLFLEAERPRMAAAGLVLNLGAYAFADGSPQLGHSVSRIGFVLPAAVGVLEAPIEVSPARVALLSQDDILPPPFPAIAVSNNALELEGANLVRNETSLELASPLWVSASNPGGSVVIAAAENAAWYAGGVVAPHLIRVRVRPEIHVGATTFQVLPGSYTARVRGTRLLDPPGPAPERARAVRSNAIGFTITPQILEVAEVPGQARVFRVTIVGDYLLSPQVVVELIVGGVAFAPESPPADGGFRIVAPDGDRLELQLTPELDALLGPSSPLPLRLVVNGAEAPPAWIQHG